MRDRKAFTLIELLAVIVILGLLMAIAIPSITRYITESRKNTMTTTINNYISSIVNEVNDLEYTFTKENTVYAIPIECIAVERGGRNPFGEWHQANDSYWAYVLVQYDSENSLYRYGFTYKDSAGYGLYPISQTKFKEIDKHIKTGLSLTRPITGKVTALTALKNWINSGLEVDETTRLDVLIAESEGKIGDGKRTCTLAQKGSNYADVEAEKARLEEERAKKYTLKATTAGNSKYFWKYKDSIKTVTFQDYLNVPGNISDDHKWDVSLNNTQTVMAYIRENQTDPDYYDLFIQGDGELYANPNSSYLFAEFLVLEEINNAEVFNTKYVVNMSNMFAFVGEETEKFIVDLSKWDTSRVTNMSNMFDYTASYATTFSIGNISNWNTSNVTNMSCMFYSVGYDLEEINLDLSKWKMSKVTNLNLMFGEFGYNANKVDINLTGWDVSNVTNMSKMFVDAALNAKTFNLIGLSNWNTLNVTNMSYMFANTGKTEQDLSKWNVNKVTLWTSLTTGSKGTFVLPSKFTN